MNSIRGWPDVTSDLFTQKEESLTLHFFAKKLSESTPLHFIQAALGHTSVAMTERYYAKFDKKSAARELLRMIEDGTISGTGGN